nr:hypothetical protein [Tanacetum cinerariifolium]
MRVNIPEFDEDNLNPKGFIDWLVSVEEVFEFEEVPENKRALKIITKLRECKKARKRTLFVEPKEWDDNGVANDDYAEALVFYDYQYEEGVVTGDVGVNLMSECKKTRKRTLFVEPEEWDDDGVANDDYVEALVFDDDQYEEEVVTGDVGVNLMGKVCTFVVDPESCDNLIAEEAVQKLGLKTENRPKPYKLQWLKKSGDVIVSKHVLVTFYVGTTYKDSV